MSYAILTDHISFMIDDMEKNEKHNWTILLRLTYHNIIFRTDASNAETCNYKVQFLVQ